MLGAGYLISHLTSHMLGERSQPQETKSHTILLKGNSQKRQIYRNNTCVVPIEPRGVDGDKP